MELSPKRRVLQLVVDDTNSTVQALDETDTLNEAFTVVVSDGAGGSVEQSPPLQCTDQTITCSATWSINL